MTAMFSHHDLEHLVGAFALDALDEEDRDVLDAHLGGCPRCRGDVAGYRETVALLAYRGEPASPVVWERIVHSLDEEPPDLDLNQVAPPPTRAAAGALPVGAAVPLRRRLLRARVFPAAAAVVALAAALTGVLGVHLAENSHLRRLGVAAARLGETDGLRAAAAAAQMDPTAQHVELTSPDGTSSARLVRLADGTGFVLADRLPALPADRTYQLWALTPGGAQVSLGVLGAAPRLAVFAMTGPARAYALTTEASGGVTTSHPLAPVLTGRVLPT